MDILDKLIETHNFIIVDNVLYIAPEHYTTEDTILKEVLNSSDYMLVPLDSLEYEAPQIEEWGKTVESVWSQQKWEDEHQDELRARLNRLDEFEEFLKKGGE